MKTASGCRAGCRAFPLTRFRRRNAASFNSFTKQRSRLAHSSSSAKLPRIPRRNPDCFRSAIRRSWGASRPGRESESQRDRTAVYRVIFHLDMDAFYASVEQREQPALRGKPVIVGAPPHQRGVVCAASYEARRFGVHSAMPSITAHHLCPNARFLRPRMDFYRAESRRIMEIVARRGAAIEPVSIDEAYLDFSSECQAADHDAALLRALPVARSLKDEIREERQLTTSIGIAGNKMLAKLASAFEKPNGLTMIPEREKVAFLRPLPVRVIYGVGKVAERILHDAGLRTVGDLQDFPGDLRKLVGSFGAVLRRYAYGEDDRPLDLGNTVKSISSEQTFLHDTENRAELRSCLKEQAAEIAAKLQRRKLHAHTVQVKVRYADFTTLTRQISLEEPIIEARAIYRLGCHLLAWHRLVSRPLRLIGLGVSSLSEGSLHQMELPLIWHGTPQRS